MGKLSKIKQYREDYGISYTMRKVYYRYQIKYKLGKKYYPIKISKEERNKEESWKPKRKAVISIVVPLYNTPEDFLCDMIESVLWQTYSGWELCLADASDEEHQKEVESIVKEYQQEDKRIKYRRLACNDGISNNTNSAIIMAQGQYIGLMDHDDILHPSALYKVMREIDRYDADFIYTDELSFDGKTDHVQSIHLKPDFKQESFRSNNYVCHFTVFDKNLLEKAGRFRKQYDGSQDYDLFLRLTSEAAVIRHIPDVLYYWRLHSGSSSSGVAPKPYIVEAGRNAVADYLRKRNEAAVVESSKEHGPFYKITYNVPENSRLFILAEDDKTARWIKASLKGTTYKGKIKVNGEVPPLDLSSYDYIIMVRKGYRPEKLSPEWLIELLQCLQPVDNHVAAPAVYDKEGNMYHAGYCFSRHWEEKIRPLYRNVPKNESGYMNRLEFRQNVSLLGGAVLAVKYETYNIWINDNYDKIQKRWKSYSMWSDQAWFSICFTAQKNFGDCVVSPYKPFICRSQVHDNEYSVVRSSEKDWKKFMNEWKDILNGHDACFNEGMRIFGKYYMMF